MELGNYRTDPKLEEEGVWLKFGEDAELLIARWNNPKARESIVRHAKNLATSDDDAVSLEKKLLSNDSSTLQLLANVLADAIFLGWRGNMTLNGEPLEYSRDQCYELMVDPYLRDLREIVLSSAMTREAFLLRQEEELVGNS